eukprot:13105546-Alexandrium_andersonii.AAC.1
MARLWHHEGALGSKCGPSAPQPSARGSNSSLRHADDALSTVDDSSAQLPTDLHRGIHSAGVGLLSNLLRIVDNNK